MRLINFSFKYSTIFTQNKDIHIKCKRFLIFDDLTKVLVFAYMDPFRRETRWI
jgi:hypothetical protein